MALALLKYQFFLKNQYWVASGILFGIAAAIWVGPDSKAGFLVIIVVFVLASVVARGLAQGIISLLQLKTQESDESNEKDAGEGAEGSSGDGSAKASAKPATEGEKSKT